MAAVDQATRPFVYAALEASGQAVIGHLDRGCKAYDARRPADGGHDPWPCSRCVSLDQLADWARRVPAASAQGWARSTGRAAAVIVPAEKKSEKSSAETKDIPGVVRYTGCTAAHPDQEDTTMSTTTAPQFTAEKFATLKSLFASVIENDIPGMAGLRSALLDAYRAGTLTGEAVDQAIMLLSDIVNPCNDDSPEVPTYPALPLERPAAPAPAASPAPEMKAGMIVTNAAGQIVRLYGRKADGKLYGKVRDADGYWEYVPGAMRGVRFLTAAEAKASGEVTHRCVFCATKLEDEGDGRSVEMGYGPVCAAKYGLPWG